MPADKQRTVLLEDDFSAYPPCERLDEIREHAFFLPTLHHDSVQLPLLEGVVIFQMLSNTRPRSPYFTASTKRFRPSCP